MKKVFLIITILLPFGLLAQNSAIDKLFEKYESKDGFTTVNISGKLLSMVSQLENNDSESAEILNNISRIRVLTVDNDELNEKINFITELKQNPTFKQLTKEYELLMDVKESDQHVKMLIKPANGDKISELLLIVGGDDNTIVVIKGMMGFNDIAQIGKTVKIGGIDHLKNISPKSK